MLGQKRDPRKALVTSGTRVLLHFGVGLQVSPQVGSIGESSVAEVAREGFLSGVRANVSLQQPRSGEGFSADGALAR